MGPSKVKQMKVLETENQRLRRAVSDLTLDYLKPPMKGRGPDGFEIHAGLGRDVYCMCHVRRSCHILPR